MEASADAGFIFNKNNHNFNFFEVQEYHMQLETMA
jgi:hypothetical protein